MDSQGGDFAFDPAMDFGAPFTTSQHLFAKSTEANASAFFADEGIDTATFGDQTVFDTTQENIFMPPTLAVDSTAVSSSSWNTQLTPQLQHGLNTFPSTPVQSFDSMYLPCPAVSLGKRPLQLDQPDFPLAKRHESAMEDFTLFPSIPVIAPATTSNWGLDTQLIPPVSTAEFGLSDEAADVCATWFHKFNVLPSDRHIESLSQLTGESTEAVRSWFGRLLKQGMGGAQGDSAYKSQTSFTQHEPFWNGSYSTDTLQSSPSSQLHLQPTESATTTPPEATCSHAPSSVKPLTTLRRSKTRCTPTDGLQLLCRDPSKIYQCTRKCGKRYGRKCDWKRNEEEGYPCKSWVCSLCISERVENVKPCFRKYHFVQHFRNIHPDINADDYEETSIVCSETEFPRNCGFCLHRFVSRQDRIDHIADHFKAGKSMLDWREDENNDGHDSDDNDDDNDDGSSGDRSNGANPDLPPPFGPSSGFESKQHGGDGGGGASGNISQATHSHGGSFQYRLSQPDQPHDYAQSPIFESCVPKGQNTQDDRNQLAASLDTGEDALHDTFVGLSEHGKQISATGDCQISVAGDELSQSIVKQPLFSQPFIRPHMIWQSLPSEETNDPLDLEAQNHGQAMNHSRRIASSSELLHPNEPNSSAVAQASYTANLSSLQVTGKRHGFSSEPPRSSASSPRSFRASSLEIPHSHPPAPQSFLSVKLLGAGGFSTVDEVVHRETNLRLGRKTLKNRDESAIEELKKEIGVLRKLRHPHVIRFLDAYSKGDKMSILLSPVAETTLALWLERTALQKPANLADTIVKMFGCLVSSVRYLHEQRPVVKHMDIKPQNILILDGNSALPQVVLCDFGISSSEDLSDKHNIPITRQYTAPEVFGGSPRKQAADIWSLGCVFAEMASVPFSQDNISWSNLRKVFSGRTGKYYWQDVPDVQFRLSACHQDATTETEMTVARTLKTMLRSKPCERPDAKSLSMTFTPSPCCLNWPNDQAIFPSPREELDWVEKLDGEDCVDCHTHYHVRDTASRASIDKISIAKTWLENCSCSHAACQHASSSDSNALPRRLLELLPDGGRGPDARVVDSVDIEPAAHRIEYVALSHTWSQDQPLLSSTTMSDLRSGLPLDQLPDALSKAISTAQDLGYRYIWTDSLCIPQDSMVDREQECRAIASVFRNAALTMVLEQPTTSETLETIPSNTGPLPSLSNYRQPESASLPALAFTTPGLAWDTRAWVLQERLLSHRFLHLGQQAYWECNTLKASETFPCGLSPLIWEKVHSAPNPHTRSRPPQISHRAEHAPNPGQPANTYLPAPLSSIPEASPRKPQRYWGTSKMQSHNIRSPVRNPHIAPHGRDATGDNKQDADGGSVPSSIAREQAAHANSGLVHVARAEKREQGLR